MSKTEISAIVFMLVSALFASIGQIMFKFTANTTNDTASLLTSSYLYLGGFAFLIGVAFMIKALRRGELTVVYPLLATSFIWVSVLSPLFFETDFMNARKWVGVAIIIAGIALIGKGRTR